MCNHYRHDIRKANLEMARYGYEEFSETRITVRLGDRLDALKSEVYPDRETIVARLDENGVVIPEIMRWGFPPVQGNLVTNVRNTRNEETGQISRFWGSFLKTEHRCLVPATAFSEWSPGPPKGERWFEPAGEPLMAFAGIWRPWAGVRGTKANPVDGEHRLFAFLTCAPNGVVKPIHPKAMPVILPRESWDVWLTAPVDEALDLQHPAPDAAIKLAA
jgi:putative SOS response-associated peptidase YedK